MKKLSYSKLLILFFSISTITVQAQYKSAEEVKRIAANEKTKGLK